MGRSCLISTLYPRLLQLGHIAIPTYGVFTALALIAALVAAMSFARRLSLDPNKIWSLGILGILSTLIGARLLLVLTALPAFRQYPFWVLGLTNAHDVWIMPLSVVFGIGAALLYALAEGLPLLSVLDCVAPATALAIGIHSIGAFLAGLDYGLPTTSPWGVTYTNLIAAFWYRTPLGVRLHPVQLYQAAASLLILLLLAWWLPRRRQTGELAGMWLLLTGLSASLLSLFRAGSGSFALSTSLAVAAVLAGGLLLLQRSKTA